MTADLRTRPLRRANRLTIALIGWKAGLDMTRPSLARAMLACLDDDMRRAPAQEIISWLAACGFSSSEISAATPLLARLLARHRRT